MKTCIMIPTVNVNGEEIESKLFKDLTKIFKDRNDVKEIWALFQIPGVGERLNLNKVNGEYLAEDVIQALDLDTVLEGKLSKTAIEKKAGFIDENDNRKTYNLYNEAVTDADVFNKESKTYNAIVARSTDGFTISISDKTNSEEQLKDQIFNSELNMKLLNILRDLGFDVSIVENLQKDGIFNPLNSEKNANDLITVIQIAKGERGEKAFPEEFSHFIIAGLRNQPLIKRALDLIANEQIENVLGDDFERYQELYKNNTQLLKEEALGKMLAEELINQNSSDNIGFLRRVWNFIKGIFKNASDKDVKNAINDARDAMKELANQIINNSSDLNINTDDVLSSNTMFKVEKASNTVEEIARENLKRLALLMKEKAANTTKGLYDKKDKKAYYEIEKLIESGKYVDSCCEFLKDALRNIEEFQKKLKDTKFKNDKNAVRLLSSKVYNLTDYIKVYNDQIKKMGALNKTYEDLGIDKADAEKISKCANEVLVAINGVEGLRNQLEHNLAVEFLKPYWKDKVINTTFIENQLITIETILTKGFNDISFADSLVNSLAESSDILLALMMKITLNQQDKRDEILLQDDAYIRDCEKKLRDAGYNDTKFMYVFDKNGKPTGWLISDRNNAAYEEAKQKYADEISKEDIPAIKKIMKKQKWEQNNTEEIIKVFNGNEVKVRVPRKMTKDGKKILYGYPEGQSPLDKLAPAQKEYYDNIIALKAEREKAIPEYKRNIYRAVQKRTDFVEELANNITNPKELMKRCLEKAKDEFVRRSDDTEFGELVKDGEKLVLLNSKDEIVKQMPIFYINPLEDMSQLSTDFGGSMRAYCAVMDNYNMMNEILPQMQLLNNIIQNRPVTMRRGGAVLKGVKKIFGETVEQEYTKKGSELRVGEASNFLLDKNFFGINKLDEGTWKVKGIELDTAKMLDFLKAYTSVVGMGFNLYSGISNLTMGGAQMLIEGTVNENFNLKDLAKAHLDYDKDILGCLAEINSVKRENKLSLLIDKFDALESFYEEIKNKSFYKNGVLRGLENMSTMILNEIGEHRLHTVTMLAILEHTKVLLNGKEISLYDAFEVSRERKDENGNVETVPPYLKLKDGVTKLDGTEFSQDDFFKMKRKVSRVNRRLHGAYSEPHKGAAHQKALWRQILQFRQWMPAFYSNRFAGAFSGNYYDVELEDTEEGYYVTTFKFATSILKDLTKLKFEIATNFKNLTPHQKKNLGRAFVEFGLLIALYGMCGLLGSIKDKESTWSEKMLYYQMLRLKLETGAGFPLHPDFLDNIWTLMQSPAASIRILNNLTDLLKFNNMFVEIQSGRYQGYSRFTKDFIEILPLYGNIRKAYDLAEDNYMFNIYNKVN